MLKLDKNSESYKLKLLQLKTNKLNMIINKNLNLVLFHQII